MHGADKPIEHVRFRGQIETIIDELGFSRAFPNPKVDSRTVFACSGLTRFPSGVYAMLTRLLTDQLNCLPTTMDVQKLRIATPSAIIWLKETMNKQTFEDARTAWRMQFALETFKSVRAGIEAMLERGLTPDSPEYYALIVGLVCLYGRPFKDSKPAGKLDEKIVPKDHKILHEELIKIRDKAFAHSDSSLALTLGEVSNELSFRRVGRRLGAFVSAVESKPAS